MTLLHAYLSKNKVKKTLALKPGQEGFSLIELVVVVAVLAVLSAIAIPQFTNISNKARTAAAMNTVATVAKECAAKIADAGVGADSQYRPPTTIDGYKNIILAADSVTGAKEDGGWYGLGDFTYASNGAETFVIGARSTSNALINCPNSGVIGLTSENPREYPNFYYEIDTGRKYCTFDAPTSGTYPASKRGCSAAAAGTW